MEEKKEDLVRISEYVKLWGGSPEAIKKKCQLDKFTSAVKIGKVWFIDKNEKPPEDGRIVDGYFRNWRKTGVCSKPIDRKLNS